MKKLFDYIMLLLAPIVAKWEGDSDMLDNGNNKG